jgi:hypothetical protein
LSPVGNGTVLSLAAAAQRQVLRRLPADWFNDAASESQRMADIAIRTARPTTDRPITVGSITDTGIGNRLARVQGIVLHTLLERAAAGASGDRPDWGRLTDALLRQHGLTPADTASARSAILEGIRNALTHEEGRWLLMTHPTAPGDRPSSEQSWNETSWSSAREGRILRQRPDRVFFAGDSPGAPGREYLWIVDYKTAALAPGNDCDALLAASREQYRSQLESYSELFRKLPELDAAAAERKHRLAIYHPMLPWLDWWSA